jgi:uncharacterized protein
MNIEKVKTFVKAKLEFEPSGHDYLHALRVYENAKALASNDMDLDVIHITALIHDMYDHKLDEEFKTSIDEIESFLQDLVLTDSQIKHIFSIIDTMSFSKGQVPGTIEGKVVQDADRLDALGAIGIARTFSYGGKHNRLIYSNVTKDGDDSISHFYQKLFHLTELMNTKQGKEEAKRRTKFMQDFIEEFYREINN